MSVAAPGDLRRASTDEGSDPQQHYSSYIHSILTPASPVNSTATTTTAAADADADAGNVSPNFPIAISANTRRRPRQSRSHGNIDPTDQTILSSDLCLINGPCSFVRVSGGNSI